VWNALPNGKRAVFYHVKRWPKLSGEDLAMVLSLLVRGEIAAHANRRCRWRRRPRRWGSWPRTGLAPSEGFDSPSGRDSRNPERA
jgi:hypothetical protein